MGDSVWPLVGWAAVVRLEAMCGFRVLSSVSTELREILISISGTFKKEAHLALSARTVMPPVAGSSTSSLSACPGTWVRPAAGSQSFLAACAVLAHSMLHETVIFPSLTPCTCKHMLLL